MNTRWSPFVKQIVAVSCLIAAVWLLFRVHLLLTPLILALLLAYLVSFPVSWVLRHTGWSRTPVVIAVQTIVLLLIATAPVLIIPWLVSLVRSFGTTLINVIQELVAVTPKPIAITPSLTIDLEPFYKPLSQALSGLLTPNLGNIQDLQSLLFPFASSAAVVVLSAVTSLLWIVFILVISFYIVKDAPRIGRYVAERMPEELRPELRQLWDELTVIWDAFVRGELVLGFTMGIIVWIATSILGLRNAPALGLLSALMEFAPGVGPVVAAAIGTLIALILGSTWIPLPHLWFGLVVAFTYLLLSQFENLYLLPHIVGRRISLHPAVVIIGALAGAQLGGVLGILLAAPTIASTRTLLAYALHKLLDQEPFPATPAPPDREQLWRELAQARPVRAILFDLDGTLIETDDQLVDNLVQRLKFMGRLATDENRRRIVRRLLMSSETFVNGAITLLDQLHLDGLLFRLDDRFRRWRGIRATEDFKAVAGSPEMLRVLADRYPLAIVTILRRQDAAAFLTQYHLTPLFHTVVTRDDVGHLKPHPAPVRLAAKQLGVPPEQCVMVGDTNVDVRAAKTGGALAVGVLCGFGDAQDFKDADLVIDSPAQLGAWL